MRRKILFTALFVMLAVVACEKNNPIIDWNPANAAETGTLSIQITDAPFPFDMVDSAYVTICRVEIGLTSDTLEDEEFLVVFDDTATFNLMELRNGNVESLGEAEVPVGSYDRIRGYISDAGLVFNDGTVFHIKVPSGEQSGVKVQVTPAVEVVSGTVSSLLLDFDLSKSFVLRGNTKQPDKIVGINFKPVVRAANVSNAGTIAGVVSNNQDEMIQDAEVWIEGDTVISTTYTDADGVYALVYIPAGIYTMYATAENYDTVSREDVEIVAGNRIIRNFTLTADTTSAETE